MFLSDFFIVMFTDQYLNSWNEFPNTHIVENAIFLHETYSNKNMLEQLFFLRFMLRIRIKVANVQYNFYSGLQTGDKFGVPG